MRARPVIPLLTIVNLLLFVLGSIPAVNEALQAQIQQRELQDRWARSRRALGRAAGAGEADLDAAIRKAEGRFPSEKDHPALSSRIRALASDAGLEIAQIEYKAAQPPRRHYPELSIQVVATGLYGAIRKFLWSIEREETPLAFRSLDVVSSEQADEAQRTVRLTLGTFMMP